MSSLPVCTKRIPSSTTEKKLQHCSSNYKTICCHGNQWSDLAEFRTHPSFYACPHCLQVWKGSDSRENVMMSFAPLKVYGIFFRRSRAANSVVHGGSHRISNSFKLLCISALTASMKWIRSKTFEKTWWRSFSHCNPISCYGNQWSHLAEFQTHPSSYACLHYLQIWKGSNLK